MNKSKVLFINPYYGKWPIWFPAFLQSCRYNPSFTWFIPTDCGIPHSAPDNVIFVESTLDQLATLASNKLGFEVKLDRPYKVNDIRPAFGLIFEKELETYDFWGHCDIDVIWGDLAQFITTDMLESKDVIATRKGKISGHCTLYRNTQKLNQLFRQHTLYKEAFTSNNSFYFDEVGMSELLTDSAINSDIKIYWPGLPFNFSDQRYLIKGKGPSFIPRYMNRWQWREGKLYELVDGEHEVMYLHFMTWKNSLKYCSFDYQDDPQSFYASYSHISIKRSRIPAQFLGWQIHELFPGHFS